MATPFEAQPRPDFRSIPSPRDKRTNSTRNRPYAAIVVLATITGGAAITAAVKLFPNTSGTNASEETPQNPAFTYATRLPAEAGQATPLIDVTREGMLPFPDRELSFITWEGPNIFIGQAALEKYPRNLTLQVLNPDFGYISTLRYEAGIVVEDETANVDELDRLDGRHFQIPLYSGEDTGVYVKTTVEDDYDNSIVELPELRIKPRVFEYPKSGPAQIRLISDVDGVTLPDVQRKVDQLAGFFPNAKPTIIARTPNSAYGQEVDSNLKAEAPSEVVEVSSRPLRIDKLERFESGVMYEAYKRIFEEAGGEGASGEASKAVGDLKDRFADTALRNTLLSEVQLFDRTDRPGISLLRYMFDSTIKDGITPAKEEDWTFADAAAGIILFANTNLYLFVERLNSLDSRQGNGTPFSNLDAARHIVYAVYNTLNTINGAEINKILPNVTLRRVPYLDVTELQFDGNGILNLEYYEKYDSDSISSGADSDCVSAGLGSCWVSPDPVS